MPKDLFSLRKIYYTTGLILTILAAIVFCANMVRRAMMWQQRNGAIDLVATLGAVPLFVIGLGIMKFARRLAAVTELLLHLREADEFHNPYAQQAEEEPKRQYPATEPPMLRCPRCLTLNEESLKQCTRCGKKLTNSQEQLP